MDSFLPSKTDLETIYKKIAPYVHNTPVLRSGMLDEISEMNIVFLHHKPEYYCKVRMRM